MPDLRAHQARLELWSAGQMLQQLDLENSRYRLGRDPACELPLAEPGLSRVHAILEKVRGLVDRVCDDPASAVAHGWTMRAAEKIWLAMFRHRLLT